MASLEEFRESYRKSSISARYSAAAHLSLTSVICLGVAAAALAWLRGPTLAELATIPLTLAYANAAEYFGHRGPMHRRFPGFFTSGDFAVESSRDFKIVLIPPALIAFFLGVFAAPMGLALGLLFSTNVALLYAATAALYVLNYEWFHFSYHLPQGHPLTRLPLIREYRLNHMAHHDPQLMTRHNFNLTYPLCDRLFGTLLLDLGGRQGRRAAARP